MSSLLLLGLLGREEKGFARIGFESPLVVLVDIAGFMTVYFGP